MIGSEIEMQHTPRGKTPVLPVMSPNAEKKTQVLHVNSPSFGMWDCQSLCSMTDHWLIMLNQAQNYDGL